MNILNPIFRYHISGVEPLFTEESPFWKLPLLGKEADGILLNEYFTLAENFLSSDNYSVLKKGLKFILKKECEIKDITQIDIYLEKHGAFYHPAKVEICITSLFPVSSDSPICFVLNCAVSPFGLALIHNEYNTLKYLCQIDENEYLPRVFAVKSMSCRDITISFMLGTWFDGYKEFHLTDNNNLYLTDNKNLKDSKTTFFVDNQSKISGYTLNMWNSDGTVIPIYPPDYFQIYEKASEILTYFYNIETFEEIAMWHHAAGDFVVKTTNDGFDVKLITVRGYESGYALEESFESETSKIEYDRSQKIGYDYSQNSEQNVYHALFLFFLKLTLFMRIDRIDGMGGRVVASSDVIPYILKGFFRELERKKRPYFIKNDLGDSFKSYLDQFSYSNIYQIYIIMIDDYSQYNYIESCFIKNQLKEHSKALYYNISDNGGNMNFI